MLIYIMIIFSVLILLSVILLIVFKGNSGEKSVMLPIIMYHDVRSDPSTVDDYTISSDQLESDLTALENAGWQPITLSSMIDYVYHDGDLPQNLYCWYLTMDIKVF